MEREGRTYFFYSLLGGANFFICRGGSYKVCSSDAYGSVPYKELLKSIRFDKIRE